MPAEIQRREGRDFSLFRSRHVAENFAEIRRAEDVPELLKIAGERGLGTVFLGGGSNIFFARGVSPTMLTDLSSVFSK